MTDSVQVDIDLAALRHNFKRVKACVPTSRVIAMLKSNAYGHGLVPCAKALDQADAFGVARFSEAKTLRDADIQQRIILMQGVFTSEHLQWLAAHDCDVVIHCQEQVELLKKTVCQKPIEIWLKVNTGLNRLGFSFEAFPQVYEAVSSLSQVKAIRLMTQFAWSEPANYSKIKNQYDRFRRLVEKKPMETSAIRSASILDEHEFKSDWVRPGIMLFGVSPYSSQQYDDLKPVMTVRAKLIATRYQEKGDKVGYGATFECPEDRLMGLVSIGYGDGYPIGAKIGTPLFIRGKRCTLATRPNMDMLHVDLHACPNAKVGDDVTLWGEGLPVEDVAKASGISSYALLASMGQRVGEIHYLNELVPTPHKTKLQKSDTPSQQ